MPTTTALAPSLRPGLKFALRRLWRDPATLQLGIDSQRAIVLTGLDGADRALIQRLQGIEPLEALIAAEPEHGCRPERVVELVTLLAEAGALEPTDRPAAYPDPTNPLAPDRMAASMLAPVGADAFDRRAATRVEMYGAGRLGATLAALLTAAGIGAVRTEDDGPLRAVDLAPGGVRSTELAPRTRGAAAQAVTELVRRSRDIGQPAAPIDRSIVVLAPTGAVIPPEWLRQVRHRPHLAIAIRDTAAVIGPLVIPGQTPCLRCMELARADRDPAWPALAAQLVGTNRGVEPSDIALVTAAAGLAAMHLLRWLDAPELDVPIVAGTLELSGDDLQLRRRSLTGHPQCGCGAGQPELDLF
jgi:bacteriocin biosynthesis cyclodehydratase domain-containing protein